MDTDRKEADMGYVKDFVGLIAQALVDASELPKQIETIRSDMAGLTADLERTKARNAELDTMLNDTRRQRDEAEQALSQVKAELATAQTEARNASVDRDNIKATLERVNHDLAEARKERDDYGLKHMAAEDRANEAEAKLKKLREALGMAEEPKPTPPPNAPPAQSYEPPKPVEPKKVYEGDFGFDDADYKTEAWDSATQRYYRTA